MRHDLESLYTQERRSHTRPNHTTDSVCHRGEMAKWIRRTLGHYHPDTDGPLDEWLASWAAQGLTPEYPWDSPPIVVNGGQVIPYALVDAALLDEHPDPALAD